ncbi:YqaJ viral recombinase family protein [Pseudoduganella sp. SL102]|uniref:YqaJ viral recombinase family protein n=1 Tax=Pseudoduganella sp. SL102 TaxID=2995154 RepID=UPI00248CC3F6|nr:YqaJ viral recombinase family protein [Pseudoduganella sp. SL102]WBS00251.1 YqaJ viral recombinase family protein [Pseudoduganella sp. SL102]
MQIHDLVQGSPEWAAFRLEHFGASEAAAMLGISSRVSRTELLHMKHTGTAQEFSDWVQKNILDYGHEVEALARPLVEEQIGDELYPVTCSTGRLSASCDGLTMGEDIAFEHKQWNEALAASIEAGRLPDEYMPQPQQIMMVTGCSKVVFVCSDGTPDRFVSIDVLPNPEWQERIRAGWNQFEADLVTYQPREYAAKPEADPIMALPALVIQIQGKVANSNLPAFQAKAERFIAAIKTDLLTDDDFANAEATVKFCEQAEDNLELAKAAALEQTVDIAELMRTIDHLSGQLRAKRLTLQKTIKDKKELIKAGILAQAKLAFQEHVAALEQEIAPLRLVFQARDFAGAMKNKRTLATLQDAVDTELAAGKISVNAIAAAVRGRLTWYREHAANHEFLFADLQNVIQKADEDFHLVVNSRIENHKRIEAEKAEKAKQVLQELEAAQAQAAAAARAQQEAAVQQQQVAVQTHQSPEAEVTWPAPGSTPAAARPAPAAAADTPPSLRLGQIGTRLGFNLTAEFLGTLGFASAGRDRAAVLYHEADFPAICAALIDHIDHVRQGMPA